MFQIAVELAAAAVVPVCAAVCCPGAAGAGSAFLAAGQKERPVGKRRPASGGLLPPLLQCWWWGRAGALVCYQGLAKQVEYIQLALLVVDLLRTEYRKSHQPCLSRLSKPRVGNSGRNCGQ